MNLELFLEWFDRILLLLITLACVYEAYLMHREKPKKRKKKRKRKLTRVLKRPKLNIVGKGTM